MALSIADRQGASGSTYPRPPPSHLLGEGVKEVPVGTVMMIPNGHLWPRCSGLPSQPLPRPAQLHKQDGSFDLQFSSESEYWTVNSSKSLLFGAQTWETPGARTMPTSHLPVVEVCLQSYFGELLSEVFSRTHGHWVKVRSCWVLRQSYRLGVKVWRPAEGGWGTFLETGFCEWGDSEQSQNGKWAGDGRTEDTISMPKTPPDAWLWLATPGFK